MSRGFRMGLLRRGLSLSFSSELSPGIVPRCRERKYTARQFTSSICSLYTSNLNCGFRQSPRFS